MAAADQAERKGAVEGASARHSADKGAARVAEKVVLQARVRQGRQADQPVLQLEEHVDARRKVMGDHGGQPNAKVDEVAVLEFERDAARDEFLSVH